MPKFPLDEAQIVALFITSVFYGILVVTFLGCLRVLLWSNTEERFRPRDQINFAMLLPALLMFIFASLDLSYGLRQNIQAFILSQGNAIKEFEKISSWLVYMKMVDYVVQTSIGDGILIYRCWVIYSKEWIVVLLPTLMWAAGTACGVVTCYLEATRTTNPQLLNSKNITPFITSMLTLTLATNLISTSLIVHRIWSVNKATPHRQNEKSRLSRIMRVLIESGLIYTISVVVLFVVYITSNNAQYPVSDAIVQIIGITFNLIIIRVHGAQGGQTLPGPALDSRMQSNRRSVPLHSIQVHTTVSRYQDSQITSTPSVRPLSSDSDSKPHVMWTAG